jgi:hypothetical protein
MGASKFFDIGGSGCAQNLHPTLRIARGDAHGQAECLPSNFHRANGVLLAAPSSREKLSECCHSDIMIMLYGVILILGCHLCDCHTRPSGQRAPPSYTSDPAETLGRAAG